MSFFRRLFPIVGGICLIAAAGFYLALQLQPEKKPIEMVLVSADHLTLMDSRWLFAQVKEEEVGTSTLRQIDEKARHPIFRYLTVTRYPPSSLYVHYALREVSFILEDYANLGLDPEGVLIALHPFHTPKKVVRVYLGEQKEKELRLGTPLRREWMDPLGLLQKKLPTLLWVDLSRLAFTLPERKLRLGLEIESPIGGKKQKLAVQLNPDHLEEGVNHLQAFLERVPILGEERSLTLDLSHSGIGFLSER